MPSRRTILRAVGTATVLGVAGCSSSCPDRGAPEPSTVVERTGEPNGPFDPVPGSRWPAPRFGPGNAGFVPDVRPPTGDVGIRWKTTLSTTASTGQVNDASAPTVADRTVYVAGESGIHALDLRDGSGKWRNTDLSPATVPSTFDYGDETAPPVVANDGTVLVVTENALVALDPDGGDETWRYEGLPSYSVPAVSGADVYVVGAGTVAAVSLAEGEEAWSAGVATGATNVPAVQDRVVVVADQGTTVALDGGNGDRLWSEPVGTDRYPVVADGTVYLGGYEGLRARSTADGSEQWTFERGSGRSISPPVVTPDALHVVEQPGEGPAATFALNRTSGAPSPRWCSYIADGAATGAAGDQSFVVRPTGGFGPEPSPSLVAFTDRFGEAVWGFATDRRLLPPAILDRAVVVGDRRGNLTAVGEV